MCKLLWCVPTKYRHITLSIETLLDLSELSIEDVSGRLAMVDQEEQAPTEPVAIGGKLIFT